MRKAFTLIEILVAIALMIVIGAVVFVNYSGRKTNTDLVSTSQSIASLLRQAQSDSMTQRSSTIWGVYFANTTTTSPYYAIYKTTYTTSNIAAYYQLPTSVAFQTSSLASGATRTITFSQINGFPSASTSIGLYMPKQKTNFMTSVYVSSSGVITY